MSAPAGPGRHISASPARRSPSQYRRQVVHTVRPCRGGRRHPVSSASTLSSSPRGQSRQVSGRPRRSRRLDRTRYSMVYVANPSEGCRGLYIAITTALGRRPGSAGQRRSRRSQTCSPPNRPSPTAKSCLIDEAHLLSPEQLEELRLLSNRRWTSSPFAGLLIGHRHFPRDSARNLRRSRSAHQRSLRDRGNGPRRIGRLPAPSSRAGGQDRSAHRRRRCRGLHRYANGIPRALNNAAMAGLMAAAADGKGLVDDLCAKKAVAELTRT